MVSVAFNFNRPAIQQELDAIGRQVLPRALAQQLDDTAFTVRNKFQDEIRRSVDRPRPFTLRPLKVTKAKWRDGDQMFASVDMPPIQANYLSFAITGQMRHPGDPGTARSDILTYSAQPTPFGGAYNKASFKRLVARAKKETTARAALRAQRVAFGAAGRLPRSLKWVSASRNAPGVFWGVVNGTHGLWQRPDRYSQAERDGIISNARSQTGHISTGGPRGGSSMPWTRPGSRLKLLLAFQSTVQTPVTIHYDDAMIAGYRQQMTEVNFLRTLQEKKHWFVSRP
ncbi:hypothetical protein [Rhizobium laguerreae]|uniref:hypothetical protein n=1 Tax=Rhizobium laguerreae TaxID=1076926 RepID=UPI001C90EE59|nr:hypothetical protein [Rhizobium laguerreae]MBY3363776.1 hypothetical protein [Rhizobium laguerreae]